MEFERLWAPWRIGYIKGEASDPSTEAVELPPGADAECFLCRASADADDQKHLVVARGQHSITVLNRYPYNNGHLLIAPRAHKADLDSLASEEHLELSQAIAEMTGLVQRLLSAQGFNIGMNLGQIAGAGLPGHLHWHIVPRWSGDTNFMPTLAGTRVIPQALDELWQVLNEACRED